MSSSRNISTTEFLVPYLDRPAPNQLREDAKADVYDVVYFLDADRTARVVAYQTIIIEELLKCGKQIIIKGKNYADNPENKFTLQMLGVVERTTRGRLRLRQGEIASNGHRIVALGPPIRRAPAG